MHISNTDIKRYLGLMVEEVTAASADNNVDLIIMGTRGANGLKELMLGSNTASVIEKTRVPVLAVPEKAKWQSFSKVVYAADFEKDDFEIIEQLVNFIKSYNSHIEILHIALRHEEELEQKLDNLFTEVKTKLNYPKMSFHISNKDNAVEGINNFIEKTEADLLCMATYQRGLIGSLFHKSITKAMAFHIHIPLLAFHKSTKD